MLISVLPLGSPPFLPCRTRRCASYLHRRDNPAYGGIIGSPQRTVRRIRRLTGSLPYSPSSKSPAIVASVRLSSSARPPNFPLHSDKSSACVLSPDVPREAH